MRVFHCEIPLSKQLVFFSTRPDTFLKLQNLLMVVTTSGANLRNIVLYLPWKKSDGKVNICFLFLIKISDFDRFKALK